MTPPRNVLICRTTLNRPGKHDGDEFVNESGRFAAILSKRYDASIHILGGGTYKQERMELNSEMATSFKDIDTIAFFCHGTSHSLGFGNYQMRDILQLAATLAKGCTPDVKIILYACLTGKDRPYLYSFAEELAFAYGELQDGMYLSVYAHTTRGHTTRNPYVVRIGPSDKNYIIKPKSALWPPWVKALKGDLRLRFPFMVQEEIENELKKGK